MNITYTTPFRVIDGIIRDAGGRKVKLWGVNYYMPFNHNYYNARELGRDHFAAVDEDIRHFKLLGVDLVRMHLYEREVTAFDGRLVENHNMEVFDYLVEQCARNGIYLMLSPITYWNTVKNQITLDQNYAYWNVWSDEAFGFTNFYSVDALLWHPEAVRCQERYIGDLFARANKFSGKRLNEYDNIVAWELMNEIVYPAEIIESLCRPEPEINAGNMFRAALSRGRMRREFAEIWGAFKAAHPEFGGDEAACAAAFQEQVLGGYFRRFWGMVDEYFGGRVVKAQFMSYSGVVGGALRKFVEDNPQLIDACSIGTYLNVGCFDSESTDHADHLDVARNWFARYADGGRIPGLATVSYEFDATGSNCGYPLAAIGAMYGRHDVQLAAYFTYTPAAVAAWNPGWLVHYMNIAHTPAKAAGFAAAGDIFRRTEPATEIAMEPDAWRGDGFAIERGRDFVCYKDPTTFRYSADNDLDPGDASRLATVSGRGRSRFAECDANSAYFLQRAGEAEWRLTLFPRQKYLCEPGRGKSYRFMANRYVNCVKEPPVSQLTEGPVRFRLNTLAIVECRAADGVEIHVASDGSVTLPPGEYTLRTAPS